MTDCQDIAVIGSAFGGSLIAMIARRLGRSVVLIERGHHPRFAIGESTTPLSNLLLESLSKRYDLPRLAALCKWGSWQREYPELGVGLKRGFTFLHHRFDPGEGAESGQLHELLVAASPADAIADTHWYRPDVDHFLQREAVATGVDYHDDVELGSVDFSGPAVRLSGTRHGEPVSFKAQFVIDASGPRGFLHQQLGFRVAEIPGVAASQALFSHFTGVRRWDEISPPQPGMPFAPDDAALHHVFPGGWMWVLRFNNGITSAGASVLPDLAAELQLSQGAPAWDRLLKRLPAVARQFNGACAIREFTSLPRMPFHSQVVPGDRWVLLPSAAGFVDPLLSTGFTLTLLGIERIATLLEKPGFPSRDELAGMALETDRDLLAAGRMIGALQSHYDRPEVFSRLLMLYFAAASFSETARRLERPHLAPGFLLRGHPEFGLASADLLQEAVRNPETAAAAVFLKRIQEAVAPVDVGGWFDPGRTRWHPVETGPLFRAASRLESSADELENLLKRAGFPETLRNRQ